MFDGGTPGRWTAGHDVDKRVHAGEASSADGSGDNEEEEDDDDASLRMHAARHGSMGVERNAVQ